MRPDERRGLWWVSGSLLVVGLLGGCTLLFPSDVGADAKPCREDGECSAELPLCRRSRCVSRCDGVVCAGDGSERCDLASGRCEPYVGAPCSVDANCPGSDQICVEGRCRSARLASCRSVPCAPGLGCVLVRGQERCLQPCAAGSCRVGERCLDPSFGRLSGFCAPNLCRPGAGPEDRLVRAADYGEACETDTSGVGACLGPLSDSRLGDVGVCVAFGQAEAGSLCDPEAAPDTALACRAGVCAEAPATDLPTCFTLCSVWQDGAQPGRCPASQACQPQWGGLGVCLNLLPGAAAAGEACELPVEGETLSCEQGSLCLPGDLQDGARRCLPICDPQAPAGAGHACARGACTPWDPVWNPFLGVCAGA